MILHRRAMSLALALTCLAAACRSPTSPDDVIRADGTLQRSVEGCFRILTPTRIYQPLDLPAELRVDGLAVHFEARLKPTFNTCMAGDVVELISIRARS